MNTAAKPEDIAFRVKELMILDGFGPDEVLSHQGEYSKELFGSNTPTGRLRIYECAQRMLREALKGN